MIELEPVYPRGETAEEGMDLDFLLTSAKEGNVLIPAALAVLANPHFEGFEVDVEPWEARPYDGWFHPSDCATWTVRQLYLHLTAPHLFTPERMSMTSVLAVTAGKFWHRFFQLLWLKSGHLVQDEVPIEDPEIHMRGHADGILATGEGLEIKSINEFQINKITNPVQLQDRKPAYWAQVQDYLGCTGWEAMRFFLINPSYPFAMSEFVVPADKSYQAERRGVYRRALELAERHPDHRFLDDRNQAEIVACCSPGSAVAKKCPAALACPIGRAGR